MGYFLYVIHIKIQITYFICKCLRGDYTDNVIDNTTKMQKIKRDYSVEFL